MTSKHDSNQNQWERVRELFSDVVERPVGERHSYLRDACGDDDALFNAVTSLLDAEVEAGPSVENIIGEAAATLVPERGDRRIGAYRVERLIGEGGMGDVYLAHRDDGKFQQQVAIKVLGHRRPGKEMIRRFEAERQILANLDHPNIARLIDGGETEDGLPFLAMEYIDGQPVTEYCDTHRLDIRARLQLFGKICAAIQHAHSNLVIHRDIKPNNILVTEQGEPKLLDFGIAKLLEPSSLPYTMVETVDSARLMTPRHASPEQIRGERVTIASDIYSLGVLLYELLSGLFPYEFSTSRAAEIENAICDTEPSKPSSRITQARSLDTASAERIAAARRARAAELARQLGGDLDNVVLTAMHKSAERRYPTARDFAADIGAYLNHRPVAARSDSWIYRGSKFFRRNRISASISAVAALLVVSATALAFTRIAEERDFAELERERAEAISGFLQGIFEVSDPEDSRGEAISARDLLNEGSRRINFELSSQPATRATMLRVLGEVNYGLGDHESAQQQLEESLRLFESLGSNYHGDAAVSMLALGIVHQDISEFERASELINRAVAIREAVSGRESFEAAEAYSVQAQMNEAIGDLVRAEALHVESLAINRRLTSGDHAFVAEGMTKLAGLYRTLGRNDEAEPMLRDAIAMQDRLYDGEHLELAQSQRQLAGLLRETRRYEESETLYKNVIAVRERLLGPDHHELANAWNSYSQMLGDKGDLDGAVDAHKTFLDILERATNGPHASFGAAYNNYAVLLKDQGDLDGSVEYYQLSMDMQDLVDLPARHPNRSFPMSGLANVYLLQGRYDECLALGRLALGIRREHFPENHRLVSDIKSMNGAALTALGEYAEAEQLLLDAYSYYVSEQGPDHRDTLQAADRLVELYAVTGAADNEARWRETVRQGDAM